MTITERPSSAAEDKDPHRRRLEAVRARGPLGLAEEIGDATHLLVELLRDPQQLFDADEHGSSDYTQMLGRIHEAGSALDALQVHTVVSHAAATRREDRQAARDQAAHEADAIPPQDRTDERADHRAGKDLSLITRRSPSEASHALDGSRRLVESMPNLLGALTDGKITADIAHKAASKASSLEPEDRRELDKLLGERLPDLDGAGTRRWGQEISAAIQGLDPDGAAGRHQRARRERCVTLRPGEHGMATLSARLAGIDAAQAHKRLSLEAERLRAGGDRRGHQAIMADVLVDTILGRDEQMDPTDLDIGLIITDRALFSPDEGEVAQVEGYGAVPAEAVREQLRAALRAPETPQQDRYGSDGPTVRAVLRRLYTHPTSGELVAVESKAKAFPPALARFLRWRDLSCRGPFCNAAIRQSDHIVPRSTGGPTSIDNGQGACAHDNGKEEHFRSVRRIVKPPGGGHQVEWISRNGISRATSPPPLTRPARPPAAPPDASPPEGGPREDSPPESGPPEDGLPPDDGLPLDDGSSPNAPSPDDGLPPEDGLPSEDGLSPDAPSPEDGLSPDAPQEAARPDSPPEATPPDGPPGDVLPGAPPDGQPPVPDQPE